MDSFHRWSLITPRASIHSPKSSISEPQHARIPLLMCFSLNFTGSVYWPPGCREVPRASLGMTTDEYWWISARKKIGRQVVEDFWMFQHDLRSDNDMYVHRLSSKPSENHRSLVILIKIAPQLDLWFQKHCKSVITIICSCRGRFKKHDSGHYCWFRCGDLFDEIEDIML